MFLGGLPVPCRGLGGEDDLVPSALDGYPYALLAGGVSVGGVDEVKPRSKALFTTATTSSRGGRVNGIPPIPALETIKPVFPSLIFIISSHTISSPTNTPKFQFTDQRPLV